MSLAIVFRREAQDEMDEAYHWYEAERAGLGEEFLAAVRDALERIRERPHLYEQVHRSLRRARVGRFPYGVFYRVGSDRIEVVAVFHGSRNPESWRSRA